MTTRAEAEQMGLRFLDQNGPHTMPNPLDSEEAICACLIFLDLEKKGLVTRTDFGGGNVQYAITDHGRLAICPLPVSA